jgi:hypothetical protein
MSKNNRQEIWVLCPVFLRVSNILNFIFHRGIFKSFSSGKTRMLKRAMEWHSGTGNI